MSIVAKRGIYKEMNSFQSREIPKFPLTFFAVSSKMKGEQHHHINYSTKGEIAMTQTDNLTALRQRMAEMRAKKANEQAKTVGKQTITDVDFYIKLVEERKRIESEIETFKAQIKTVMTTKGVEELYGESGRSVYLLPVDKVKVTGNFTSYDTDEIEEFIPFEYRDIVYKTVVDRDVLESLVNAGKIDETVLELKIKEPGEPQLRVR